MHELSRINPSFTPGEQRNTFNMKAVFFLLVGLILASAVVAGKINFAYLYFAKTITLFFSLSKLGFLKLLLVHLLILAC